MTARQFKLFIDEYNDSIFFKIAVIGVVALLLLLPVDMIKDLITERYARSTEATKEVRSIWGKQQIVGGPILTIPYLSHNTLKGKDSPNSSGFNGQTATQKKAVFLPEQLNFTSKVIPEIRYRGTFQVLVYKTVIDVTGRFDHPDFSKLNIKEQDVLWDKALISVHVSDKKGIRKTPIIRFGDHSKELSSLFQKIKGFDSLIQARIPEMGKLKDQPKHTFSYRLDISGSESLHFLPLGKQTHVKMSSNWSTPKFSGNYLPYTRTISPDGFSAEWSVLNMVTEYPQYWVEDDRGAYNVPQLTLGTTLLFPVSIYLQTTRAVKYSVLFIALTFLSFLLFETIGKLKIHPIQYLLIGSAICLFYVNLLSMSEWIGFSQAYLLSSISTTVLIFGYSLAILKAKVKAALMSVILSSLYGFLYVLLLLENYSLLLGSIGLIFILGAIMFVTKNLDWYGGKTIPGKDNNRTA